MREMPSYLDFPGIPLESAASWSTRRRVVHTDPTATIAFIAQIRALEILGYREQNSDMAYCSTCICKGQTITHQN